ncbi:uncharacterized protein [Haliotis cracherodii]
MEQAPLVKITSQIYFQRFRYGTENRGGRKTRDEDFMEVMVRNIPRGAVMKVFCIKVADELYPHPNSVDGQNCTQGVYSPPAFRRHYGEETIKIPWLQINRTKKGNMVTALENRQTELPQVYKGGCQALMESLRQGAKVETNQVYLCVHVSWNNHQGIWDVSKLIKNEDKCSSLRIEELSPPSVTVDGERVLILLTEDSPGIEPEKLQVKIEEVAADNSITWRSEIFTPVKEDIRYKHVITYQVPKYKDRQILEPVCVNVVICCKQTGVEDRKPILYKPLSDIVALNRGKRKRSVFEKYGEKVQKVTDGRCVKKELYKKIMCGGVSPVPCPAGASLAPATTQSSPMELQQAPGSQGEAVEYHLPCQMTQLMERDLICGAPDVEQCVRVPLSKDTSEGRLRQMVLIRDENSSVSSADSENHNMPQSVIEAWEIPDEGLQSRKRARNSNQNDKLTMMKKYMTNQEHHQSGLPENGTTEDMHSDPVGETTGGNPGFQMQMSGPIPMESSPGMHARRQNDIGSSPGHSAFQLPGQNDVGSSPGHSAFQLPGQEDGEFSQGISGFQIQSLGQNALATSNENPGFQIQMSGQTPVETSQGISDFQIQAQVHNALATSNGNPGFQMLMSGQTPVETSQGQNALATSNGNPGFQMPMSGQNPVETSQAQGQNGNPGQNDIQLDIPLNTIDLETIITGGPYESGGLFKEFFQNTDGDKS